MGGPLTTQYLLNYNRSCSFLFAQYALKNGECIYGEFLNADVQQVILILNSNPCWAAYKHREFVSIENKSQDS